MNHICKTYSSTERIISPFKSIHRLVGGHLHHSVYRKEEKNFPTQSSGTSLRTYIRQKPWISSTTPKLYETAQPTTPYPIVRIETASKSAAFIRNVTLSTESSTPVQESTTTKESVFIVNAQSVDDSSYANEIKKDGFVESSAGEGRDEKKSDEFKKTLSDQVAEGKYGLIQNELFKTAPKRLGILSYAPNPEIPGDTVKNLGGLSQKEIWLSEDHLLVLKGGSLNTEGNDDPWKPIDNYQAPMRQVKIPENPAIPPPFPVQLEENGSIEFIGNNQLPPLINPFTNESLLLFPEGGFPKTETYSDDKTYLYARPGAFENDKNVSSLPIPYGVPNHNFTIGDPFLGHFPPPLFPPPIRPFSNGSLENSNITEFFDEDDPSFYYPPPYSFKYNANYTNAVAPGPLVPGIILPPPPNFFGRLEEINVKKERVSTTTVKPSTTSSTHKPFKQITRPIQKLNAFKSISTTSRSPVTSKSWLKNAVKTHVETITMNTPVVTKLPVITATKSASSQLKRMKNSDMLRFVPKEAIIADPQSKVKGKPIYYEYFDARISTNSPVPVYTTSTTSTTAATPSVQSIRIKSHPTIKQTNQRPYNAYLPVKTPSDYEKYIVVTPKPETKPNFISSNVVQIGDHQIYKNSLKPTPLRAYNSEIENIRHTIEFFKQQEKQKKQNDSVIRNPKTQSVYEYSFDAAPDKTNSKLFHPGQLDSLPFKPMVKYSAPLNAENGFKAIAYTTVPTASTESITTTPTAAIKPSLSNLQYLPLLNGAPLKKPAVHFIPFDSGVLKTIPLKHSKYSGVTPTHSPFTHTTVHPWVTVEKQVLREVLPKEINVQIQSHTPTMHPPSVLQGFVAPHESSYVDAYDNRDAFGGNYYPFKASPTYFQPKQPIITAQQNAYLRQIETIRKQINQNTNIKYHVRVANNSSSNQNYGFIKPLAANGGFISPYHFESQRFPHLSQILSPNYNLHAQQQRLPQAYHPLHRDVLVNYKYPLPDINPDSEFLPPPHLLHPLPPVPPPEITPFHQYNRNARLVPKPHTVIQYKLPGDQNAGVYFYTPQVEKYSNSNMKKF